MHQHALVRFCGLAGHFFFQLTLVPIGLIDWFMVTEQSFMGASVCFSQTAQPYLYHLQYLRGTPTHRIFCLT